MNLMANAYCARRKQYAYMFYENRATTFFSTESRENTDAMCERNQKDAPKPIKRHSRLSSLFAYAKTIYFHLDSMNLTIITSCVFHFSIIPTMRK